MPEIAEIARAVHFLRRHLVGRKIKKATAVDDANVFGKVGTTGSDVSAALTGKKVLAAGQQGKYFWLVLDSPPHPVLHFGMTGWIHIKSDQTAYTNYYKSMKPEELELWPPKYWKLRIETDDKPAVEVAYTDPRRFGRIRLVDCPGEDIRKYSPLKENGPDPVVDTDIFTEDYLRQKMKSRHVPIKALLLDQAMISGIGNWVGDEVLYHAKLHPEQYSNDFSNEEIARLYKAICYVCQLACDKLGDSDEFPEDWMFNYRWGKGKKHSHLPNGQKLAFLKVGGRTSCYAPGVQKNTGSVVDGIKEEAIESEDDAPKKKRPAAKSKSTAKQETEALESGEGTKKRKKTAPKPTGKEEDHDGTDAEPEDKKFASRAKVKKVDLEETDRKPPLKKRRAAKGPASRVLGTNGKTANTSKKAKPEEESFLPARNGGASRRSSRLSSKAA